jgi:ribosome-binding ATPase YchF (GTP1/OBG family)
MEIGQLDADEAEAFRSEMGLADPGLERVIRASYALLGLISFFTAGPDETRAWTIERGSTAVDAAGAIHSDLARGFIRAEVIGWQELLELGSIARARLHGRGTTSRTSALGGQGLRRPGRRRHRGPLQRLSPRCGRWRRMAHRPRTCSIVKPG